VGFYIEELLLKQLSLEILSIRQSVLKQLSKEVLQKLSDYHLTKSVD
jgi:hypothetical protein